MRRSFLQSVTPLVFLSIVIAFSSCRQTTVKKPEAEKISSTVPPVSDVVMYELFIRNFSNEGTVNAIIPRLNEIKNLGVNTIWLMPIQPIGKENKKGTYGSPYAISDYFALHPDFGTKADFKNLVDSAHAKGLYIIIDEVANHTAWDSKWVTEHPEWYTHDSTGKIIPPVPDWSDVADLNFENTELRKEMIRSMKYWVDSFNIDGYRCDAASMVPHDFWKEAITELRKSRPLLMLAESDDSTMYDVGFDMTYGWEMYHKLLKIWQNKTTLNAFDSVLVKEKRKYPHNYRPLRFITNHDENSWDDVPQVKFQSVDGSKAAFAIMMTLPGVPFVYQGEEVGYPTRVNLFEKYNIDWSANTDLRNFYKAMLHMYDSSEVLKSGSLQRIDAHNNDVLMYTRTLNAGTWIVMVNVRNKNAKATIPKELMDKNYSDALSNQQLVMTSDLTFAPYEFRILRSQSSE